MRPSSPGSCLTLRLTHPCQQGGDITRRDAAPYSSFRHFGAKYEKAVPNGKSRTLRPGEGPAYSLLMPKNTAVARFLPFALTPALAGCGGVPVSQAVPDTTLQVDYRLDARDELYKHTQIFQNAPLFTSPIDSRLKNIQLTGKALASLSLKSWWVNNPRLQSRACHCTPPQLRIPFQGLSFGFSVRHIRGG